MPGLHSFCVGIILFGKTKSKKKNEVYLFVYTGWSNFQFCYDDSILQVTMTL